MRNESIFIIGPCQLKHVKRGIPYGQALRYRTTCNSDDVFEERLNNFGEYFIKRGFRKNSVDSHFRKAKGKRRENRLSQGVNSKMDFEQTPLVITFHSALTGVGKVVDSL